MQYKTGTVDLTNGSANIVGTGTLWASEVNVGDIFTRPGDGVWYEVAAVTDDTHIQLSAPYAGVTGAAVSYAITRDFTTNYGFPYPNKTDVETASIVKRMAEDIDARLKVVEDKVDLYHP